MVPLSAGATVPRCLGASIRLAQEWPVHSTSRPRPPVVTPAPSGTPGAPPSDAIVLFDGRNLDAWRQQRDSAPARWTVRDGHIEIEPGSGSIETRRAFGDVQLHIEWATPSPPGGSGQGRGNSGVFLMGYYEVQILDSYGNETYADGQAAALYGQVPPLVNTSRLPGEWQSYDVVFRCPRFAADGSVREPARMTVHHNGVLVHDAVRLQGRTVHGRRATYQPHPDRLPLALQDHGDRVRFRNIWVRELADTP